MATIDSKQIIDDIIAGKYDNYPGEPRAIKIVEYTNAWGKRTWGVVHAGEDQYRYERETEYVRDPVVIWRR